MTLLEIFVVAVALAMDAFAVAIASGVMLRQVSKRQAFRLSWHFGLFQALMPIIGWAAGLTVRSYIERFDHWVAFGLLVFVGGRMVIDAVRGEDEMKRHAEPTRGWTLVVLSVATSIDALAVGLSLALLGVSVWLPALVIGVVAATFTLLGLRLGTFVGRRLPVGRYAAVGGGLVLLFIGVRILADHGVF